MTLPKGGWWPIGLASVLAATIAANGFLLFQATRGGGMPIEADYYRKAVAWDSTMAQSVRNQALGWKVGASLDGNGTLSVALTDQTGLPITGAEVSVDGFPIAFVDGGFTAALTADQGHHYRGSVKLAHAGLYELRVRAVRGPDRFTAVLRGAPGAAWAPKT
jgi:nitrogen fixation protein FixH